MSGRAAGPGFRLIKSELAPHERDVGDALLRAAAAQAGWPDGIVELPEVQIAVSVARRKARWEDPNAHPPAQEDYFEPADALSDSELLALALEIAARFGDPNPVLVRHARGTRFDVTSATGSTVFDDTPSCIFAMQGNFRWSHSCPANRDRELTEQDISYEFMTFVFDAVTGKLMDVGGSHQPRDLSPLGPVITDYPESAA